MQTTCAVFVAALLLGAPARAALVVGADGKPIRRGTGQGLLIGEAHDGDGDCKVPPDNRTVAFNLAPETKLADAIAWISSVTCKSFLVRDTILAAARPLTMVAPERITPDEAYRLFLGALDSAGLSVEPCGKFRRVVEVGPGFLRIVAAGGVVMRSFVEEPYVTALVRLHDLPPEERKRLLAPTKGEVCDCMVIASDTVVITEPRAVIERLLRRPIPTR